MMQIKIQRLSKFLKPPEFKGLTYFFPPQFLVKDLTQIIRFKEQTTIFQGKTLSLIKYYNQVENLLKKKERKNP